MTVMLTLFYGFFYYLETVNDVRQILLQNDSALMQHRLASSKEKNSKNNESILHFKFRTMI